MWAHPRSLWVAGRWGFVCPRFLGTGLMLVEREKLMRLQGRFAGLDSAGRVGLSVRRVRSATIPGWVLYWRS